MDKKHVYSYNFFFETETRTSLLIRTQSTRVLYKESQKEVVNKGDLEGYSYNKREQPKGKGQEGPPHKKLKNDGLLIVENHRKATITKVFGVIHTSPRGCVLQHSPKRIKRIIAILKNSTVPFFPNAPQKRLDSTSP